MKDIARKLLKCGAVVINPDPHEEFWLYDDILSPMRYDTQVALGYPSIYADIGEAFINTITKIMETKDCEGVEKDGDESKIVLVSDGKGAIAWGALAAGWHHLPFAYIVSEKAGCGTLRKMVGRELKKKDKVIIIKDCVALGQSSLYTMKMIKRTGAEVVGMITIINHNILETSRQFEKNGLKHYTLTHYKELVNAAEELGYISAQQKDLLQKWPENPRKWGRT